MKFAITLSTTELETVFNALRLGNYARAQGDDVGVFLIGAGVDLERVADPRFDLTGQAQRLRDGGGQILACRSCLKLRDEGGSELCPLSTMADLYALVRDADRVISL
jgi:sulfur relay (sulfurtransferase) complex TusBCD TusD component (DsrE family)